MSISERIKAVREKFDLTQEEFGDRLRVSRDVVNNLERKNNPTKPSDLIISKLNSEFHINETWLKTGEGEMFAERHGDEELIEYFDSLLTCDDKNAVQARAIIRTMSRIPPEAWSTLLEIIKTYKTCIGEEKQKAEEK